MEEGGRGRYLSSFAFLSSLACRFSSQPLIIAWPDDLQGTLAIVPCEPPPLLALISPGKRDHGHPKWLGTLLAWVKKGFFCRLQAFSFFSTTIILTTRLPVLWYSSSPSNPATGPPASSKHHGVSAHQLEVPVQRVAV